MLIVQRFLSEDGQTFTTADECSRHERKVLAEKSIREAYEVPIKTGRVESLLVSMLAEPEAALAALTAMVNGPEPEGPVRRVRTTKELTDAIVEFVKSKERTSISAVFKTVGGKKERIQAILRDSGLFAVDEGYWYLKPTTN